MSTPNTRCDSNKSNNSTPEGYVPPPTMRRPLTFEEKLYQKVCVPDLQTILHPVVCVAHTFNVSLNQNRWFQLVVLEQLTF